MNLSIKKIAVFIAAVLFISIIGLTSPIYASGLDPILSVESPANNSNVTEDIQVSGFALSSNSVSKVNIYVDGTNVGQATYGISRQDVANKYPAYPNAATSGFQYKLNTRGYSDGLHVIKVEMIDGNSTATTSSLNVQIKNQRTPIMGQAVASMGQMIKYFLENNSDKDYNYINNFASIVIEEANIEGVRADVAFAQMMKETNFLKFTGNVRAWQNNFAGLGATGPVPADPNQPYGCTFPDVRTGIRAVIQHLQCYASNQPLKQPKVDPRYGDWLRQKAPYVEWLGIQENPYGTGWASDTHYGYDIVNRVNYISNINLPKATINNLNVPAENAFGSNISISTDAVSTNRVLYKYYIKDVSTGVWTTLQNYSENSSIVWTPKKSGQYIIEVYVKDILSSNDRDDSVRKTITVNPSVPTTINSFDITSEVTLGQTVTGKVNAVSATKTLYKFYVKDVSTGIWTTIVNYNENNSFSFVPSKVGQYVIEAYVKDELSSNDKDASIRKIVEVKPRVEATINNFDVNQDVTIGESVQGTVSANSGNKVLYKFYVKDVSTGVWTTLQNYNENNILSWTPSKPGQYIVEVYVKDILSSNERDDSVRKNIVVSPKSEAILSSFTLPSSGCVGGIVTGTANANSTNKALYKFYLKDLSNGTWTTIQNYGENNTLTWVPIKPGQYTIEVYAKDIYSKNEKDSTMRKNITIKSKTIVLDAGHGGSDPGAQGNGYNEKDLNMQIVQKLGNKLLNLGFNVLYTRQPSNDTYVSLEDRANFANNNNADLFISIHHDSSSSSSAAGTSTHYSSFRPGLDIKDAYVEYNGKRYPVLYEDSGTIYYSDNGVKKSVSVNDATAYDPTPTDAAAKSATLANDIVNAISSLGLNNRGSRDHNLYVTRWTNMPSILVEAGFISNPDEISKISTSSFQDKIAQKIADIVSMFFGS